MTTVEILDKLQQDALRDVELRQRLLATRREVNPLSAFCRACQALGYEIYQMDLLQAGE